MALPITIRPAIQEDVVVIFSFVNELEEADFDFPLFREYYQHNIAQTDNIYLVAVDAGNEVIGHISCHGQLLLHHLGKVFEIQEMFVQERYRGRGVGALLVRALEAALQKKEYQLLEVTTNIKRTATQAFYIKNGFQQTHVKFTKPK